MEGRAVKREGEVGNPVTRFREGQNCCDGKGKIVSLRP